MNMNKKIEEEIFATAKFLTKWYGLNKSDINRLKNILIQIAQNYFGEQFNLVETTEKTDFDLEYRVWLQPNLRDYFSKIPNNKVFEIFENNELNDLIALESFFSNLDFHFLFTYEELYSIIKPFIKYLSSNRNSIISTGFPFKSFGLSYWFYNNLSRLYPLKQPYAILRKEKDKDGNFLLEYHWIKRPGNQFKSSDLEKQDFINAPYNLPRFTFNTIDLIENKRSTLFDLKIEILNIIFDVLLDKNYVGLWGKCFRCIADKLELEDFKSFIQIGEINYFYPNIYTEKNRKNLFKKYNMSGSDYFFEQGGLTQIIELIFQVEKEFRLGHINKIKNKLITLSKNKIISTYYDFLLNIDLSELFTIGEEFREYQKEENEYRNFFEERLSNDLKKSFETSLSDKPNRSNSIELIINSLMNKINSKTDFTESRNTSKTNTNNIIPIKLPPNTKWKDITIQFLDYDKVKITAPNNIKKRVNYQRMGFEDQKSKKPNKQWQFLYKLAPFRGDLTWTIASYRKRVDTHPLSTPLARKWKQRLANSLKKYFKIDEDPFHPYNKYRAYKLKFTLLPEPSHMKNLP